MSNILTSLLAIVLGAIAYAFLSQHTSEGTSWAIKESLNFLAFLGFIIGYTVQSLKVKKLRDELNQLKGETK